MFTFVERSKENKENIPLRFILSDKCTNACEAEVNFSDKFGIVRESLGCRHSRHDLSIIDLNKGLTFSRASETQT